MEGIIKIILSCGYTIVILTIFSIILSSGEIMYTPQAVLLIISVLIGIALIALAILLAKGKFRSI